MKSEVSSSSHSISVSTTVQYKPTGAEHRQISQNIGAFVREAEFYTEILEDMKRLATSVGAPGKCHPDVPGCVFAKGTGDDASIVMEDLGALGYRLANRFVRCTIFFFFNFSVFLNRIELVSHCCFSDH